ncbi:5'-methylthioadenosine/S-adenosylhomocysteine nucleosidase family protein [Almyronema epifaneia]|uniref:Nucleoside phosphorylase domain-containing protein n=1 Tax=Almyronema epifaneia S1 TaxID=2991925 RepID=A0ABW6ICR8_9CYAN
MPRAVIVTALSTEYLAVHEHLTDLREETHRQGTIYERGIFSVQGRNWEIVIAEIGAGNIGSAVETERAIAHFSPEVVLFVGVAGGVKDVALGDVVASTKVYGYESGKAEQTFRPRPEVVLSAHSLEQRARAEAKRGDWLKRLHPSPATIPRVFVAPIASGEKVVASKESDIFNFLRSHYGDAVAVEMDGFGLLEAARINHAVPAIVIRGISDLIDGKSKADVEGFQEIAARHASAFAFELLAKLPKGKEEQRVSPARMKQPRTQRELERLTELERQRTELLQEIAKFENMRNRASSSATGDLENIIISRKESLEKVDQEISKIRNEIGE